MISINTFEIVTCYVFLATRHLGSSSQTKDQTHAPCIGSVESQPLDHQGGLQCVFYNYRTSRFGLFTFQAVNSHRWPGATVLDSTALYILSFTLRWQQTLGERFIWIIFHTTYGATLGVILDTHQHLLWDAEASIEAADPYVAVSPFWGHKGTCRLPWWLRRERIHLQCGGPGFNPRVGKIPWCEKLTEVAERPMNVGLWVCLWELEQNLYLLSCENCINLMLNRFTVLFRSTISFYCSVYSFY